MASITGIFSRSGNGFLEQRRECCGALRGLSHSEFALAYRDQAVLLHGSGAEAGPEPPSRPGASIVSPFVLIGAATIYNRSELVSEVGLDRNSASDLDLLRGAYAQWGAACPSRMLGDWAFAAWHPKERRLFLARDQSGATSLYYYADTDVFIFSTSRRTLLNLKLASVELDELYLAQILVSWFAYQGERTIHSPIKRLPFAHCLTVTPDRLDLRQYWRLDDTAERHLPGRQDCVAALRDVFDRAVRERLPAAGTLAATLSGGLNSGAIAVTAAEMLRHRGQRLDAYISVPLSDPSRYVAQGSGDEFSLAQCTAKTAANIDLHRIEARRIEPNSGDQGRSRHLPRTAACRGEPILVARAAKDRGARRAYPHTHRAIGECRDFMERRLFFAAAVGAAEKCRHAAMARRQCAETSPERAHRTHSPPVAFAQLASECHRTGICQPDSAFRAQAG